MSGLSLKCLAPKSWPFQRACHCRVQEIFHMRYLLLICRANFAPEKSIRNEIQRQGFEEVRPSQYLGAQTDFGSSGMVPQSVGEATGLVTSGMHVGATWPPSRDCLALAPQSRDISGLFCDTSIQFTRNWSSCIGTQPMSATAVGEPKVKSLDRFPAQPKVQPLQTVSRPPRVTSTSTSLCVCV